MEAAWKERKEREKVEILMRFRNFAERSKWTKARLSRELGVSVSTVERWLDGQQNILLASVLAIRQFLEEWESSSALSEGSGRFSTPNSRPRHFVPGYDQPVPPGQKAIRPSQGLALSSAYGVSIPRNRPTKTDRLRGWKPRTGPGNSGRFEKVRHPESRRP
jgi:transcriptional regulator with XRE-family HTH domain